MTEIAPIARIDCSVIELEPAVVDALGNVVSPPVLQLPDLQMVDPTDEEIAQIQADQEAHAAAQAAYQAAPATAADHAAASADLVTEKLATVPIPRDQLPAILQGLLGEASSAIPFFEKYALDPSPTAQQWTDFQTLPQQTKDRLLYDVLRSVAALMRYLTGDLPPAA